MPPEIGPQNPPGGLSTRQSRPSRRRHLHLLRRPAPCRVNSSSRQSATPLVAIGRVLKEGRHDQTEETEHPHPLGRRHRLVEHQLQQPRPDGLPHAEHRPRRQRGRGLHRLLRAAELHRRPRRLHHRPEPDPHRPDQGRHARRRRRPAARRTRPSPSCSSRSATPPASSARTTSATRTSSCRRCTASTSSSATSTTSTPRRSPRTRTIRRTRSSGSGSAPAASCTPGPTARAGRRSRTPAR